MELLLFLAVVVLLDVMALRFGQDNRDDVWTDERRLSLREYPTTQ